MKHSVFLICGNASNYYFYLTTKDTDFSSKSDIKHWSFDRESATVFFSKQAAEEHIELYATKLLEYTTKQIHNSELWGQETKQKRYIDAYDTYWRQLKVLIPMEVQL